jgi:hypothetical protein
MNLDYFSRFEGVEEKHITQNKWKKARKELLKNKWCR